MSIQCAKWPGTRGLDVFASKSIVQEIITCAFSSGLGDWAVVARGDFNFFLYGVQNGPGLGDLMLLPLLVQVRGSRPSPEQLPVRPGWIIAEECEAQGSARMGTLSQATRICCSMLRITLLCVCLFSKLFFKFSMNPIWSNFLKN